MWWDYIHIQGLILQFAFLLSMMRNTKQVWRRANFEQTGTVLLLHFPNTLLYASPQHDSVVESNQPPNNPVFSEIDHQISLELRTSKI